MANLQEQTGIPERLKLLRRSRREQQFVASFTRFLRQVNGRENREARRLVTIVKTLGRDITARLRVIDPAQFDARALQSLQLSVGEAASEFARQFDSNLDAGIRDAFALGEESTVTGLARINLRVALPSVDPALLESLLAFKGSLVVGAANDFAAAINGEISRGVVGGLRPDQVIRNLRLRVFGPARTIDGHVGRLPRPIFRAINTARTEIGRAYSAARQQRIVQLAKEIPGVQKEWVTVIDGRERGSHTAADGQVVLWNRSFLVGGVRLAFPRDPAGPASEVINCFPADTCVSGLFNAGLKAWYSGEMIEIKTAMGRRVSLTVNHPVPTLLGGLVAADRLLEGDHLLTHLPPLGPVSHRAPQHHDQQGPTLIEDIFDAFRNQGTSLPYLPRSGDFDGDSEFFTGEVEVVWPKRVLRRESNPSLDGGDKPSFGFGLMGDSLHARSGPTDLSLQTVSASSTRSPSSGTLALHRPAVRLHPGPLGSFRFGSASDVNTSLKEARSKSPSVATSFVRETLHRFPGQILSDEIVEIRRYKFSGHVYDLQSPRGWIVANGIVCCNCRCEALEVPPKGQEWDDVLDRREKRAMAGRIL